MARREERAYREYVSDEQRSPAGCIGGQTGQIVSVGTLRPTCGGLRECADQEEYLYEGL
jgi:hypothetical protein